MKWTDTQEIAMALTDKHQAVDPQTVRFTDLHRWGMELDGFDDDPNRSNEKRRVAIQVVGIEDADY